MQQKPRMAALAVPVGVAALLRLAPLKGKLWDECNEEQTVVARPFDTADEVKVL